MPPIYHGSTPVTKMYLGGTQLSAAYLGVQSLLSGPAALAIENLLLVGASIENFTFNSAADATDFQSRITATVPAAAGKITVYNESANGRDSGACLSDWNATIRAKYSTGGAIPLPYNAKTMAVFMCYGNDITNQQPYDASDEANFVSIRNNIISMISDCEARGWDWHVIDISWRDYSGDGFENEDKYAIRWRDGVTHWINQNRPHPYKNRFFGDGSSWLNYYQLWMRNASFMSDATHNGLGVVSNPVRQHIVDALIAPSYTGVTPANKAFVLPAVGSDGVGDQCVFTFGNSETKVRSANASMLGQYSGRSDLGRKRSNGQDMPIFLRQIAGSTNANTQGANTLTIPGYFTGDDMQQSLYCTGSTVAKYAIKRLNPAASYELVMSGSRGTASTDLTRMTRIDIVTGTPTVGGSTQQFSASNPASGTTANSVTFVVTPNASGVIEFEMSNDDRVSTSRFGYLGALSVKRVA